MAIVNKTIDDSATGTNSPGDYEVELLNVPTGKTYAITTIMVCNPNVPSGEILTFDLHFIPAGEPLNVLKTAVVRGLTLPAGETFTFDSEKVVLDENDRVVIFGAPINGDALSATVSYLEV